MKFEKKQLPWRKRIELTTSPWLPKIHFVEVWTLA
jgi:hypothetical protein